jgi:iron complex transport system permease protein
MKTSRHPSHPLRLMLILSGLLLALLGAGLCVGSTGFDAIWHWPSDPLAWQIVWQIRAPRTLGAALAGGLLGLAGALAQGLFRNPLADPFLLGSASGASLAVALMLGFAGASPLSLSLAAHIGLTGGAFIGATLAVMLALSLSRGLQHTEQLLLAGVVVGVMLGAITSIVTTAMPHTLQAMQTFMLGSTAWVGWSACTIMAGTGLLCLGLGLAFAHVLDALALGETTATSLGLPVASARMVLVGALALATGCAVAHTGLIAFVGLAAPHVVRTWGMAAHRYTLCASTLSGAALLLGADLLARWLLAPTELPVGVMTALLGGCYLLVRMQQR